MTSPQVSEPKAKKPDWLWIGLCVLVGVAAIFVAWRLVLPNPDLNAMPAFWSGVLINVGTSILLAGVLFVLERRFVKETRVVVAEAAEAAATQAVEHASNANNQLGARVSELEARLNEQLAEQQRIHDEALSSLTSDASYESVFPSLKMAYELGAVSQQGLTIPAGPDAGSPRIRFVYEPAFYDDEGGGHEEQLTVQYVAERKPNEMGTPIVSTLWHAGDHPTDVFRRLMADMVRSGRGNDTKRLKIGNAFTNLALALKEAMSARRGDESWQSGGSVIELLTDGWILTENGVETRGHGIVATPPQFTPPFSASERQAWRLPDKPKWADPEVWKVAMQRGQQELPTYSPFPF
ncbi:hypothetical protein [Pseudarthrobacter sp. B4EP4b]|uniref:hypothetical protein n=1 Tax=Pseudarthrobacter sp. B4EP4b TaxID=2590664 RepID=UPI00114D8D38|nr:hypothetical protein [Pseudarthrobacter sp. B4EP4b]